MFVKLVDANVAQEEQEKSISWNDSGESNKWRLVAFYYHWQLEEISLDPFQFSTMLKCVQRRSYVNVGSADVI